MDTVRRFLRHNVLRGRGTAAMGVVMDDSSFAFSALPHPPPDLAAAHHQEELGAAGRTVVTVLGAMRGVGGIDSWGADVEPAYQLSAEGDIAFSFYLQPDPLPGS